MKAHAESATVPPVTDRPSRAKPREELARDPMFLKRRFVGIKMRQEFYDAIEKHRGEKSWSVAAHQVLEAGLKSLGWKFKSQLPDE